MNLATAKAEVKAATGMPVYCDYQATTPLDKRVLEKMLPYFGEKFGNPHSRSHAYGWQAEEAVEIARRQIAKLIHADAREIVFTSGATEANNLAIKGSAHANDKRHIITVATEHKCVLASCRVLEAEGFEVTVLPVDGDGIISLDDLRAAIRPDTLLFSMMAVNNEIGVIQPVTEAGAICRDKGVLFHCDAAQAFGKIPLDVNAMNIDLMSISGHKIYGPQGIGALYVRRRPKVHIKPIIDGGGQERGVRSGTLPVALAVGLGAAAEIAMAEMDSERERMDGFYRKFLAATVDAFPDKIQLNGSRQKRWPGNLNLGFPGTRAGEIMLALKSLALSSGAACASGTAEPSYVLQAIGVPQNIAHSCIRLGFGRMTTADEMEFIITEITGALKKCQK